MEFLRDADYQYIRNKYHDTTKPFNNMRRFISHEEIYDESTGLSPAEVAAGIFENDKQYTEFLHPVRKARAFEYVLDNTRIACDKRDRFPAVCSLDRPLTGLINEWKQEIYDHLIPEVEARRAQLEREGAVTIWPDYDHSVPVWDTVFALGFPGLLKNSEAARKDRELTQEQVAFFDSIKITYEAIIRFLGRLEARAVTEENPRLAKALHSIALDAPKTFYEALLLDFIYFLLSEHIEGIQVRALANFDRHMLPFYENDLQNGVSEEELQTDLAYFLMQFTAIDNYFNQPVYLGGTKADETSQINRLSYVFLDVYDRMGLMNPKIQIKYGENTPDEFAKKALDMIRRGHSSIVFVMEKTLIASLMKRGETWDDARLCDVKGCYEYNIQGGLDTGMNYLNLVLPLLATMAEVPDEADFDAFYQAYKGKLKTAIDEAVEIVNGLEEYLADINPQPMLSATYATALERALDPLAGGARSNGASLAFGFIANVADSLTAIKELVYNNKEMTLSQFKTILDQNYEGNEVLRRRIIRKMDHYGNNKPVPDGFARDIAAFVVGCLDGRKTCAKRNGPWSAHFHVARMSYEQGKVTPASPDGRLAGEELSKNISASMGRCENGVTASILSATKIDASAFTGDAALDVGIHPTAVRGEEGMTAMLGLLKAFEKRGGHAIQFNVFNADILRAAQKEPEKYQDLQIRVCGWNVLFNDIKKEEQDGFIRQAEAMA